MTYRDLIQLFREEYDPFDPYGSAMAVMFDVAAAIHNRDPGQVPDRWAYRPGAGGAVIESDDWQEYLSEAATPEIERFGDFLERVTERCSRHGMDY